MKKLLSLITIISILLLSSCDFSSSGISVDETGEYIKITLDKFEGDKKIKINHDNPGECSLDYKTSITEGDISVSYKEPWFPNTHHIFSASAGNDANSGTYIDSSITKITITLEASQPTSGEILICFSAKSSPFK